MKRMHIEDFKKILETESHNRSIDFVNVCTPAEYNEKHIPGVRNVPLDEIESRKGEFAGKETIYLHCRSGNRSMKAIEKLKDLGVKAELVNVEGGLLAWDEAGYTTRTLTKRMPVMRQVMLVAGTLTIAAVLGSVVIHPSFIYLALLVGAGLSFSGLTGWCGMAYVLARMPWNK